jgi:hypothetical protein
MKMMHDIDYELQLMLDGKFTEARAISDKLEKLGPEGIPDTEGKLGNPEMWTRHSFNRGWFMIQDGEYQKGCQLLESGRFIKVYGSPPLNTNAPIYNPTEHDIKGKSIIISLEGGFGDEIIHARFVKSFKDLGASKVYLAASPEIVSVFERIEGCDGVILRNASHTVAHDYWVPGFSAGWVSGNTFKNFPNKPYINAKPESIEMWKSVIKSDKIKVGIRWAGNPKFEHQQFRRFPPHFLTELGKYDEVQLYSLQRDQNIIELPENIVDLQHLLISWEDTLAAIQNLDIVITSCTSIAHAAAALGKETWVLTPILPYHTWTFGAPKSTKSPYYECVSLYRQQKAKSWNETFQKLYKDFEKRFNLKHIEHPSHDKEPKKVNLGCGYMKLDGYLNVDSSEFVEPDQVVDLQQLPWPYDNDEFQHIVAKDILEHLGNDKHSLVDIIKEMYRVSENGAVWEVQVPHHRSDHAWDDPTHKRPITPGTFKIFDQKNIVEGMEIGRSDSTLAVELGIDIDVCDVKYTYVGKWMEMLRDKQITEEQLEFALHTQSNVAEATIMLLQVHKPPRYTVQELKDTIKRRNDKRKAVLGLAKPE